MSASFVLEEQNDRVAILTLNRPETRNAFSTVEDCAALADALRRAKGDRAISVAIITGAGSAFCSGGDLRTIKNRDGIGPRETPDDTRANYRGGVGEMMRALEDLEIVTIAAINGPAIGLGLGVAALCDLRVAEQSAIMASSFVKVGITPGDGSAWILPRLVGYSRAAEMVLTGDSIDAEQALALGLVNRVAPDGEGLAAAKALAQRITANPPRALRLTKRMLREGRHGRLADVLELAAAFQALAHETADHREAVDAFFEKRPPKFTGG
jgi:enoyl-CoA hydratase/carnithine racemase